MYDDFCGVCGFALEKHQQNVTLKCEGTDYFRHCGIVLCMTLCPECWETIQQIAAGGLDAARERTVDLKLHDLGQLREMEVAKEGYKANFKKRRDDDDDKRDGGVSAVLPPT